MVSALRGAASGFIVVTTNKSGPLMTGRAEAAEPTGAGAAARTWGGYAAGADGEDCAGELGIQADANDPASRSMSVFRVFMAATARSIAEDFAEKYRKLVPLLVQAR